MFRCSVGTNHDHFPPIQWVQIKHTCSVFEPGLLAAGSALRLSQDCLARLQWRLQAAPHFDRFMFHATTKSSLSWHSTRRHTSDLEEKEMRSFLIVHHTLSTWIYFKPEGVWTIRTLSGCLWFASSDTMAKSLRCANNHSSTLQQAVLQYFCKHCSWAMAIGRRRRQIKTEPFKHIVDI